MSAEIDRARNKYRPSNIKLIFIAEAPPSAVDRFFYYENVVTQDNLFLQLMEVLYPKLIASYSPTPNVRRNKRIFLERFRKDGYYLLDAKNTPIEPDESKEVQLRRELPILIETLDLLRAKDLPLILISKTVYDVCTTPLRQHGFKVSNTSLIDFPGSGRQTIFRSKLTDLLATYQT